MSNYRKTGVYDTLRTMNIGEVLLVPSTQPGDPDVMATVMLVESQTDRRFRVEYAQNGMGLRLWREA